jgi:glycosyltransferase involved in cell wall biosynthesis
MRMSAPAVGIEKPDLSIVMPCYNEEAIIGFTIPKLAQAFDKAGYRLELVAVDNGSADRTGEIIRQLAEKYASVVFHRVEKNEGYGWGVLCGMQVCTADWVGIIPADGQVDAEDVVLLFETALASDGRVLAKVRRRFRMDGLTRKVVSTGFNVFIRVLWPRLESIDINGSPKILPRAVMRAMKLRSKDWFLDAEMMVKAHHMGVRVREVNVFARLRGNGLSHVRMSTCWLFLKRLLQFRFSHGWQTDVHPVPRGAEFMNQGLESSSGVRS